MGACGTSARDDARDRLNEHIDSVAAETATWAAHKSGTGGLPDTRQVLERVVATVDASARELGSEVRVADPDGTGPLGDVRVALEGSGSNWLWSQDEALYVFCARFTVTRQPGRPRVVSAELFDCPPDAVPSGWNPTGQPLPAPTGIPS